MGQTTTTTNKPSAWKREAENAKQRIDHEHGLQLILVDQLQRALERAPHDVANRFSDLRAASELHFGNEEALMRQHTYPKYGVHTEEHRRITETLHDLERRYGLGEELADKVGAIRLWLGSHITGPDHEFDEFMQREG